jgi:hypothetical protein
MQHQVKSSIQKPTGFVCSTKSDLVLITMRGQAQKAVEALKKNLRKLDKEMEAAYAR